ncbi:MAG: ribonuclease H family protein [Bacteroidales bacterium]|nr:ribonuclease H family protein [Bacteroidales bacterium]
MQSNKYYVVWKGYAPGVYDSWEEAEIQVSGYPDAQYRAYKTQEAAVDAFREGYDKEGLIQEVARQMQNISAEGVKIEVKPQQPKPVPYLLDALAVDAACSGNPGPMEYRGVYVRTGQEIFRVGPLEQGTNNIGEFLAIVHGLALQEKQGTALPIYSDSVNAQLWVQQGVCKTKLEETEVNAPIFDMIERAENWLRTHSFRLPIYKWETKQWGEIPADFGRK